jgi:hypothetical protein
MSRGTLAGLLFGDALPPETAAAERGSGAGGVLQARPAASPPVADAPAPELPFDVLHMLRQGIRVKPAEFARMVGVSRSAVTEWKKSGLIDVGPDGKVNPVVAARQLQERADPARLRAPLLRQVMESTADAQARAAKLAAKVGALRADLAEEKALADRREQAAKYREQEAAAVALLRLSEALVARFAEAIEAHAAGRLARWFDELTAVEFYGLDLAQYRADFPEDEADEGGELEPQP